MTGRAVFCDRAEGSVDGWRTCNGEDRAEKGKMYEKVIASKGFGDYHDLFDE